MIDWRVWLLSALARRLGLTYSVIGEHQTTGERAFLFAHSEELAHALALQLCLQHTVAHANAAAAELSDLHAAESLH